MEKLQQGLRKTVPFFNKQRRDSTSSLNNLLNYDLKKEIDRRKSFVENDWSCPHVQFGDLAITGLYFVKKPDLVRCYFCSVDLKEFEANDDVIKEHLRFSPNCPLLRRDKTNNVPLDSAELDKILPPASYDECGLGPARRRKKSRVEDDVAFPEYRLYTARMKTFETWPVGIKQKPINLSEAGFFYGGQSDFTMCFSCGVIVGKWEADDNPWVEHKKLAKRACPYLQLNQERLKENEKKYEEAIKIKTLEEEKSADDEPSAREVDHETVCKVCLERKSSVCFLPCKHVAVCGQCVFGLNNTCPICRCTIEETIPLFYA